MFKVILSVLEILFLGALMINIFRIINANASLCHPQCLEYVQSQVSNLGGGYGNAHGLWNKVSVRNNGWRRVTKGGSEHPNIGDILYWNISPNGHVAMIRNVISNKVYIDDRNWDLDCTLRFDIEVDLENPNIVGWITNKSITPPQTETETNTTAYANSGQLAWIPLGVDCKDAMKWIDIETGNVVADKSNQSVSGDVVCENYGIYPTCGINNSQY